MNNSKLVDYIKISPNITTNRNSTIDRITPHCVVGQVSVESLGSWFSKKSTGASSNYGIGKDGRIGMYCCENDRSWCTSSKSNDHRAITIECASDITHPHTLNDIVYDRLIELCVDICVRNGKSRLLWIEDKNRALSYVPASDEMILTIHRWFANTECPGDWLYSRMGDIAERVTTQLVVVPYLVRVAIDDLNMRIGPSISYARIGYIPKGVYTIVERNGEWGRLKSKQMHNGKYVTAWIHLGYATKV